MIDNWYDKRTVQHLVVSIREAQILQCYHKFEWKLKQFLERWQKIVDFSGSVDLETTLQMLT